MHTSLKNRITLHGGTGKVGTLIYPVVDTGAGGLGTHLTVDLNGGVKFGPMLSGYKIQWMWHPHRNRRSWLRRKQP